MKTAASALQGYLTDAYPRVSPWLPKFFSYYRTCIFIAVFLRWAISFMIFCNKVPCVVIKIAIVIAFVVIVVIIITTIIIIIIIIIITIIIITITISGLVVCIGS